MSIKIYENDDIYVRPLTEADINKESYKQWFFDQEVCKFNSHGKMSHTWEKPEFDQDKTVVWAVIAKRLYPIEGDGHAFFKDVHIGNVVLYIDWINRNAEFGCIFGEKKMWGLGICTQVMRWLFDHGFNKLNLHKIWLGTVSGNEGMEHAAEKVGMKLEAKLCDDVFINGIFENVIRYAIRKV